MACKRLLHLCARNIQQFIKVTLEVPQDDNKTKELEFERKGGKFVLEAQLDATIKGTIPFWQRTTATRQLLI